MTPFDRSRESHLEGFVDCVVDGCVHGWAWNPDQPEAPVAIQIVADGQTVASCEATLYRPDLERAGKGHGRHGFELLIPQSLRGSSALELRVTFVVSGHELHGSPILVPPRTEAQQSSAAPIASSYRSRFGGFWTDLPTATNIVDGRRALGWITSHEAELLTRWVVDGFVVLKSAVPAADIDALDADVERVWAGAASTRPFVEYWENGERTTRTAGPEHRDRRLKLLDLHGQLESARRVAFPPAVTRFLTLVFDRPLLGFQSLYFRWGSTQDIHQDSAFVKVSAPMELAAAWVALEDVQPGSGELEYYVASHTLEDYLFDGHAKWMPLRSKEYESFVRSLHERCESRGLLRETFRPSKGDVLIWSADLAHGGRKDPLPSVTRKSLVTHYCPQDRQPMFEAAGRAVPRRPINAEAALTFEHRG